MPSIKKMFSYYPMNYFTDTKVAVEVPDIIRGKCNMALLKDGTRWGFLSYCFTNYTPEELALIRVDFFKLEKLWNELAAGIHWEDSTEGMLHFMVVTEWGLHNGDYSNISHSFLDEALKILFEAEDKETAKELEQEEVGKEHVK